MIILADIVKSTSMHNPNPSPVDNSSALYAIKNTPDDQNTNFLLPFSGEWRAVQQLSRGAKDTSYGFFFQTHKTTE
jgi:hypothetical protein